MTRCKAKSIIWVAALCLLSTPAFAQGVFDSTADWSGRGDVKADGSVDFSGGEYTLEGNGDDIWNEQDEAFFVYTNKSGNWQLSGKAEWIDPGANAWAKLGIMVREGGDNVAAKNYYTAIRGANDLVTVQWRNSEGASSSSTRHTEAGSAISTDGGMYLRLTRLASDMFLTEWSRDGENWFYGHLHQNEFADEVAYGFAITNHDDNDFLASGTMSDVELTEVGDVVIAERSFGLAGVTDGGTLDVTLTFHGSGTVDVTETLPDGWTAADISNGGSADGNVITWSGLSVADGDTVTYTATATGANADDAMTRWITGNVDGLSIAGTNIVALLQPGIGIFDVGSTDIGGVGFAGFSDDLGDVITVQGSGADIWGGADQFHFLFGRASGAFEFEAKITGAGAHDWSKIGLMVRQDLSPGSPNFIGLIRGSDLRFRTQARLTQGAASVGTTGLLGADLTNDEVLDDEGFTRVKIVRSGNNFESFYWNNANSEWVAYGSESIPMTDPVLFGFAVTSHDNNDIAFGDIKDQQLTEFPFEISRVLGITALAPGSSADGSITITVREGQSHDITVTENYPDGTSLSNVSASAGDVSDDGSGTLTWTLTGASGTVTLNYTITADADASGEGTLSGTFESDEFSGNLGDITLLLADLDPDLGELFQGHMDIGAPGADGGVIREGETWKVIGSGHDIWDAADDFHFLYFKAEGDFEITIDEPYIGAFSILPSGNTWQKMGLMARDELTPESAYAYACLRSSDQAFMLQWRESAGAGASWDGDGTLMPAADWNPNWDPASEGISNPTFDEISHGGTLKLIREGNDFLSAIIWEGEEFINNVHTVEMTDPIYVGIAVTSHETGSLSQGIFKNAQFTGDVVSVSNWMLH